MMGEMLTWSNPAKREFDNRLYYPIGLTLFTGTGTIEIDDDFIHLGNGRFWIAGFVVRYNSRRCVQGDVFMIKASLREELAWLEGVEIEIEEVERWIVRGEGKVGKEIEVGQWRDESGRAVKRELRPEMFI